MTTIVETHVRIPAARFAPESCIDSVPRKAEGAGKTGCWLHPRPRVQCRKHTSYSPQVQPERPGLPCAMVYGLWRALPGVRDLIVTVACRSSPASLAPAQGCQDHTSLPSAAPITRQSMWQASIATRLAFVTTRPPLCSSRDCVTIIINYGKTKAKYFLQRGWTGIRKVHLSGKSLCPSYWIVARFRPAHFVIASEAKQSRILPRAQSGLLRRLRSSQ
jgi:hypothetical protein